MKKQLILLLLLCLFTIGSSAQTQDFYYLMDNKTHAITKVSGKYFVEFTVDSLQPQTPPGTKVGRTCYVVTDTSTISSFGFPYTITPAYVANGDTIYYVNKINLHFKDSTDSTSRASIISTYNLSLLSANEIYESYATPTDALQLSKTVYETGLVTFCEPNFYMTFHHLYSVNDAYFAKQWYLHNTAQGTNDGKTTTNDADIDALEAWDLSTGNSNIIIAVLDEGISAGHPDLPTSRQRRLNGSNFAKDYDGTFDANNPSPTVSTTINNNHGNACAGVIAASHNTEGIAGIAPQCKIMPVKLPLGTLGSVNDYANAITFASLNAQIMNLSFGGTDPSSVITSTILAAIGRNTTVIIAAGNTAERYTLGFPGYILFPGNVFVDDVITVAASDRNDSVADYSPSGFELELAAPSHTAYPDQITGETYNMWTIDIPGVNYGNNDFKQILKVQYPPLGETLPASGTNWDSYTGRFGGTSAAAPQVAGVAALMLSVHPCMKVGQIKDILQSTADKIGGYDYDWMGHLAGHPKAPGYSNELGYGKLNAYRAVKAALDLYPIRSSDIVYIKDNVADVGLVGVNSTGGGDKSPDIWVRNQNDGFINYSHENPFFTSSGYASGSSSPCYVYVRVHNKGCDNFSGTITPSYPVKLSLYWSKASTWSSWPSNWDGSAPTIGNKIASLNLPPIAAGQSVIIEFPWTMINPYVNKTWNSCLLARIENYSLDIITDYPGRLDQEVKHNNNIAMRNLTIMGTEPSSFKPESPVLIGNIEASQRAYDIKLSVPGLGTTPRGDVTSQAEVRLHFDSLGWAIMNNSGAFSQQQGIQVMQDKSIIVQSPNVVLSNINFPADTRIPVDVSFNFLIDEQTTDTIFDYTISQSYTDTPDMVLGTEWYLVHKQQRESFNANAGADTTINKGASATLCAHAIADSAIYIWYDAAGNMVDTGISITVSPTSNTEYTLELISLVDGFKDYDKVMVHVRQYFINSVSPNPATTQLSIGYDASSASTASIAFLLANGSTYSTHNLDPAQSSISINTSQYPQGVYQVVMIANGQTVDAKSVQIN